MTDNTLPILSIGVVGAGAMGRGIAQVAATAGIKVHMFDSNAAVVHEACAFITRMLNRAVEKGRMDAEEATAAIAQVHGTEDLAKLEDCQIVIEAVIENIDIKRTVFAQLEEIAGKNAILATNTSSLSVTAIAAGCQFPERVVGMHFFNPVPMMKLVEVISGELTLPSHADTLMELGKRLGKVPVRVADVPGFLVNQVGRGYNIEAAHAVTEGVSEFADVDRIMRDIAGFRMGPFELMDLTAIDVTHPATVAIYRQFYDEPRFRPSQMMNTRLDAGLFGRKTGQGFYVYEDGKQQVPEEPGHGDYDGRPIWVSEANMAGAVRIRELLTELGANQDTNSRPGDGSLILLAPLGMDTTSAALSDGLDPKRCLAVDTLFDMSKRRVLMKNPLSDPDFTSAAAGLFSADGAKVTVIRDSAGFVAQRLVAMIVNIGCSIAQAGTATPDDIDQAVMLGLNYPRGPFGFADMIGADNILAVLSAMHDLTGDPRYRPTPWLRRRAGLGVPLGTLEN